MPLCPVCGVACGKSCVDCEQQFCANHIYSCADCGNQYCADCFDAHHVDGHWSDSDTAFELAASRGVVRASSINSPDLWSSALRAYGSSCSFELAASRGVVRASSINSPDLELAASQRAGCSSFAFDLVASHRDDRSSSAFELASSHRVALSPSADLRPSTRATSNQKGQASWSAIPAKLKFLVSRRALENVFRNKLQALHPGRVFRIRQLRATTCRATRLARTYRFRFHLTHLATLVASAFQNTALEPEAGS